MSESIFKINLEDKNKIIPDPSSKNNYLIWVECEDKNFYDNVKLLYGKDLGDENGFYLNRSGNIVDKKGRILIQSAVDTFPELHKALFENCCGLNSSTDFQLRCTCTYNKKVKFVAPENGETRPKFEIESIGDPNEKFEIYIDDKGNFVDKDNKSIGIFGSRIVHENEEDYLRGVTQKNITDVPLMIDLARKQKLDMNIFKYIQVERVKNPKLDCSNFAWYLQRENLKTGETENIYIDKDNYIIDKETGEKINDKDSGQPYRIQDKYPEVLSHIYNTESDGKFEIKDKAMYYEISNFEVVLNSKTGFLITMKNVFAPFKSATFFVDKKDGKIYDENGEQPQKITDIANCKLENSSIDQCSNIFFDPELYSMCQQLIEYKHADLIEYYVDGVGTVEYTNDKGEKVSEQAISVYAEVFGHETLSCYVNKYGHIFILNKDDNGNVKKTYCYLRYGEIQTDNQYDPSIFSELSDGPQCLLKELRKSGFFLKSLDFSLRKNEEGSSIEEKLKTKDGKEITTYKVDVLYKDIDTRKFILSIDKNTGDLCAVYEDEPQIAKPVCLLYYNRFRTHSHQDDIFRHSCYAKGREYRKLVNYLQKKCGLFKVDFVIKPDPEKTKKTLKYKYEVGDKEKIDEREINIDYEVEVRVAGYNQTVKLFVSDRFIYEDPENDENSPVYELLESMGVIDSYNKFDTISDYWRFGNDYGLLDKLGSYESFKPKYYLKQEKKKIEYDNEFIEVQELAVKTGNKEDKIFVSTDGTDAYIEEENSNGNKSFVQCRFNYFGLPKPSYYWDYDKNLDKIPSLKKVLNANGIKVKGNFENEYQISTDLITVKAGADKITGYKVIQKNDFSEETFIVDEATARIFSFECKYSWDHLELNLANDYRIDAEDRKKIFERFKEKGLFSPKYNVLNKDKNNGLVTREILVTEEIDGKEVEKKLEVGGYEVEIECNGKKTGTVFVQNDYTQRIYDQNGEIRKKINPLTGVITDGPSWLSDLGLKDLRKTFMNSGIKLKNYEDNFLGVEKYESDSSLDLFGLNFKDIDPEEELKNLLYVDKNGYMRKKGYDFFINLAGLNVYGDDKENTKFLPALRRVYTETEVQKKLVELFGPEVYKKSWYEEPNQRLKSIEFMKDENGDLKYDEFNLKIIIGPEDEGKQEEKNILVKIDQDGYMRDENNNFIDINGYELDGGVIAANLPELQKAIENKGYIKTLPGYVDPDKKLNYLIEKVDGDENLIKATITMPKPESEGEQKKDPVVFYVTKDGEVYKDKEKQDKQKLVIDNNKKIAWLGNLQPDEKFNLLENKNQEFTDLLYEIQKFDDKFLNKKEQEKPSVPNENYSKFVKKARDATLYFSKVYGDKWSKNLSDMNLDDLSKELKNTLGEDVLNTFSSKTNKFIDKNNKNGELSVDGKKGNPIDLNKVKDFMAQKFNVSKYSKIIGGSLAGTGSVSACGLGVLIAFGFVNSWTLLPAGAAVLGGLGWLLIEYSLKKYNKDKEFNVAIDKNKKAVEYDEKGKPKQKVEDRVNVFEKLNSVVEQKTKETGKSR